MSFGWQCEVDGRASRRLQLSHLSSTHKFCVAPAPLHHRSPARAIHGYCDQCVCAHVSWDSLLHMIVLAQAISVHGQTVCCAQYTFAPYSNMSRYTREYGQASSWYNRGWAPPAKQHTKNSHSGWSKRATRGYHSDNDDRSRQWKTASQAARPRTMRGASEVATEGRG